jgi:hypothetical protein
MKTNVVGWFEIPVTDMDRAVKFYNEVFQIEISIHDLGELKMGWFPFSEDPEAKGAAGSLVQHKEFYKPSMDGILVYFTSPSGDIEIELSRIEKAGGKILKTRTEIGGGYGYMALFLDTEGNRVALHSRK